MYKLFRGIILVLVLGVVLALLSSDTANNLPTIYKNPQGSCIGSKPTGLCYSDSLGEHTVLTIE